MGNGISTNEPFGYDFGTYEASFPPNVTYGTSYLELVAVFFVVFFTVYLGRISDKIDDELDALGWLSWATFASIVIGTATILFTALFINIIPNSTAIVPAIFMACAGGAVAFLASAVTLWKPKPEEDDDLAGRMRELAARVRALEDQRKNV